MHAVITLGQGDTCINMFILCMRKKETYLQLDRDLFDSVSRTLSTSYIVLLEYVLCNLSFLSFLEIIFFQQKIHFYNAREDCKKAQYLHDIFFNLYCLIT